MGRAAEEDMQKIALDWWLLAAAMTGLLALLVSVPKL